MAPRPAPRSDCLGCPALPCPALFVTTNKERAPKGTGSDWKNCVQREMQQLIRKWKRVSRGCQSSVPDDNVFPYGRFCNMMSFKHSPEEILMYLLIDYFFHTLIYFLFLFYFCFVFTTMNECKHKILEAFVFYFFVFFFHFCF
jgi:hypothetical protein